MYMQTQFLDKLQGDIQALLSKDMDITQTLFRGVTVLASVTQLSGTQKRKLLIGTIRTYLLDHDMSVEWLDANGANVVTFLVDTARLFKSQERSGFCPMWC